MKGWVCKRKTEDGVKWLVCKGKTEEEEEEEEEEGGGEVMG